MTEYQKNNISNIYNDFGKETKKDLPNLEKISNEDELNRTINHQIKKNRRYNDEHMEVKTHTEADLNWASLANKVTIPNIVKGGVTLGSGYAGSILGVGLATGLGFALLGPGGAAIGYYVGNVLGFGAGAIGGHKFGKYVADRLEDKNHKDIVENGRSNIIIDSKNDINAKKEKKAK